MGWRDWYRSRKHWESCKILKNQSGVSRKSNFSFNRKNRQIEVCTKGHYCIEQWYLCKKGVVTASKAHKVRTKMKKVTKGDRGAANIWSLKEKNSGMTFVNQNIPALKYGRDRD